MAPCCVRRYEDSDYEAVCALFTRGMMEHVPAAYWHMLRSASLWLLCLGLFLAVLLGTGSLLAALGTLLLLLTGVWFYMRALWLDYVHESLRQDMLDIRRTYLGAADTCMWVAEAAGAVLGMVGVMVPEDPSEQGWALELRRMSVGREHRGQGVARMLCRTVVRFAQERGYGAVVLSTSVVQVSAQRLYESEGFRRVSKAFPSRLAKLLGFYIIHYQYEIPGGR
ncbi:N-acetyltransferase 8B-like [Carettochelys insculpta]|uniref:N-acetyltransferase 8B-like n=1 Tax=Carettochelys insculpta TaxID=44489 RepID=UPI003EBD5A48